MTQQQIRSALRAKKNVIQTASLKVGAAMSWPIMGIMTQNGQMLAQSLYQPGQWYKTDGSDISVR